MAMARAVAAYLNKNNGLASCRIETVAGALDCTTQLDRVNVTMPAPKFGWQDIPLAKDIGKTNGVVLHPDLPPAFLVNVGNPHAVIFAAKKPNGWLQNMAASWNIMSCFPIAPISILCSNIDNLNAQPWAFTHGSAGQG